MYKVLLSLIFTSVLFSPLKTDEIPENFCEGIEFALRAHPDPTRCTEYVMCFFGDSFLQSCTQRNEIFYETRGFCVRGDPETCEVYTTTPRPTTTEAPPPPPVGTDPPTTTKSQDSGPTTFPTPPVTPDGSITPRSTTTTSTSTTTTIADTTTPDEVLPPPVGTDPPHFPDDICEGFDIVGPLPYPGDCTKFIVCVHGSLYQVAQCYPGYIFHVDDCIPGNRYTCQPNPEAILKMK